VTSSRGVKKPPVLTGGCVTDPTYRGQGLAEKLVAAGVEKARKEGKKIIPLCPFAKKEFEEKSEYADVLRK
jgi:predicted GNAT family acetyltransferase